MEAYRALSGKLPNATSAILPPGQLKHFASLEHPERILAHTRSFLARESAGVIAARAIG
jgi:hypothetical protein